MEIFQALLYIGLLFSFSLVFYKLIFPSGRVQHKNLPPSPPRIPILGHFHLLKKPFHHALHNLSQKYGPVFFLWLGWRPVLVISTPSAIEECFTKNDIIFANRPLFPSTRLLEKGSLVMSPYGPYWRNLRRFAASEIFSSARIQMTSRIRADEVRCLAKKLFARGNRKPAEVNSLFYVLTFNIMMKMVSGERYFEGDELESEKGRVEFNDIKQTFAPLSGPAVGDFFPFLEFLSNVIGRVKSERLQRKRDAFMQNLVDAQRRRKKRSCPVTEEGDEKRKNIIDVMLMLQESEPEFYTDAVIKAIIKVMLVGGTDASTTTLEAAVSFLISNPNEFNKARDEIDSNVGQSRLVDDGDLSKLTYLHCIINEALRLGPTVPLSVLHKVSEDCVVGGFTVPSGTILLVNNWALHNDPTLWADPTLFKPERFNGPEGEKVGYKFVPFGSGRRACPGVSLAMRVMALALGTLIQCFDWEKGEENSEGGGNGRKMENGRLMPILFRPRKALMDALSEL
ncbi:cytochrome P450 81Q32-like isoform X2 [Rhododendron vialii]|uniref:cytochrome P450 81Q32-like isoform X2 n=1 Tax=Rhododendron vialii TaxID=182163 RepID=UPI00265D973F|nr:cytochrome P450 81Q32-like isoform X2 [Rhododendron vialii]